MTKLELGKSIMGVFVTAGVSKIVSSVVENNVFTKTKFDKVIVFCGRVAISSAVSEFSKRNLERKIDEAITWWAENVSEKSNS